MINISTNKNIFMIHYKVNFSLKIYKNQDQHKPNLIHHY